jgi:hypothetical protein
MLQAESGVMGDSGSVRLAGGGASRSSVVVRFGDTSVFSFIQFCASDDAQPPNIMLASQMINPKFFFLLLPYLTSKRGRNAGQRRKFTSAYFYILSRAKRLDFS